MVLPLFAAPVHECSYDGNGDEDYPSRMGLSKAEPHVEEPGNSSRRIDTADELRQATSVDKVANGVVDGNLKDEEEPHAPCAV